MNIVEVIKEGEILRMPEFQARQEDLFILRKIIAEEPERVETAPRLSVREEKAKSRLEQWKSGRFAYKKNNVVNDLVYNFHWEIVKGRRMMNVSRKQLANSIGVSEEEIKMIEMGELPRDDFILINKIENKLGIVLRKNKPAESVDLVELQKKHEAGKMFVGGKAESARKENKDGSGNFLGADIEILD